MKVLLIGWDGACWSVIRRYLDSGKLPTVRKLLLNGIVGELKSAVPFSSGPVWTSIVTGVNPGKQNIFHFFRANGYDIKLNNGSFRRPTPIWDIIGQAGMKVAVVNIPMTYPPEPVNGVMVSGMDTPSHNNHFTYPDELQDSLIRSDYLITWGAKNFKQGKGKEFLAKLLEMERRRGELVANLLRYR